ncbi:ParB/RepB/Spo0J family partition protein [Streptomyces sp. NPDC001787]|uniref:ParB/RepB/Spo0J family partition protein n=1 Tax=Streptomyces sp. NPDC001787 TaxID=3154523 RepID=UPI0033185018
MPNKNLAAARTAASTQRLFSQATAELPITDLLPSPENGRKRIRNVEGLADSFDDDGVVQALTVVTAATFVDHYPQHREYVEASKKPYVVLHGHRRLAAAERRGLEKVPVFLRKKIDGSIRLAAIKENEQRLGLDPIEQGEDYQKALNELSISQRELARRLGNTSQTAISHRIKLLNLITPLREAVVDHWCKKNGLEVEHSGKLLLPVKEAATVLAGLREALQQAFVDGKLSFSQAETIIKGKVPIEEQQLPSSAPEPEPKPSLAPEPEPKLEPAPNPEVNQEPVEKEPHTSQRQEAPAEDGWGTDKSAPLPTQRDSGNNDERPDSEGQEGASKAESSPAGNLAPAPDAPASEEPSPANSAVATLTERGVIPVTTVKDIYKGLKERLSRKEFEELQDLILSD